MFSVHPVSYTHLDVYKRQHPMKILNAHKWVTSPCSARCPKTGSSCPKYDFSTRLFCRSVKRDMCLSVYAGVKMNDLQFIPGATVKVTLHNVFPTTDIMYKEDRNIACVTVNII